jgi:hypothetical protein
LTKVLDVALLIIAAFTAKLAFASEQYLSVCVPDQNVPPFYTIEGSQLSGFTVDRLNSLFQQDVLEHIPLDYVLQPWQRCLKAIEEGSIDMLIAGYSQDRATKAVYPDAMGFDLKKSTFSFAQVCLVKRRRAHWTWNGEQLEGRDSLTLGLESGFLLPNLDNVERTVSVWDMSKKYELVKMERVDAVLTVCGIMDEKSIPDESRITSDLEVVFPPYINSPAYMVFSSDFYRRHSDKAELILDVLIKSNNTSPFL